MSRNVSLIRLGHLMEIVGEPLYGVAGVAYSYQLEGSGGTAPYTFTGASLPSGWSVVAGEIAHAGPASGAYEITVQMADSARNTPVQRTYLILIA